MRYACVAALMLGAAPALADGHAALGDDLEAELAHTASDPEEEFQAVAVDIEGCALTVEASVFTRGGLVDVEISGDLSDLDPESTRPGGAPGERVLVASVAPGGAQWEITADVLSDHPNFAEMVDMVGSGEVEGTCNDALCDIRIDLDRIEIPAAGQDEAGFEELTAKLATLIGVCQQEG